MIFRLAISILLSLSCILFSCRSGCDPEAEKEKIRQLMEQIREAHLEKDALKFFHGNAEHWYDVRRGRIRKIEKSGKIRGTQSYLDNMEFLELKALDDTQIEVSDDGSMASYLGSVVVRGYLKAAPVFWVVAWQSVLRKTGGEWKIISTANTEAPDTNTLLFVQGHELHWLSLRPEDRLRGAAFKGFTTFDEQTAFRIEFRDLLDRPLNFYYSFENYLPLGFETPTDREGEQVTVFFRSREKRNGLSLLKKAVFVQGDFVFEYNFTEIKINQLTNEMFESREPFIH